MSLMGIVGALPRQLNKIVAAISEHATRLLGSQERCVRELMVEFGLISRSQGT